MAIQGTDFTDMGRDRNPDRFFYTFIHNVYGCFFRDMMDYFLFIYPRFEWWAMGTYDKAVEYLDKYSVLGSSNQLIAAQIPREQDMPMKAAIIMNPLGEFAPADGNAGGKQLWRFPNLASSFVSRLFDPIYQDSHVKISPGFQRIKGEVELIMMVESFYEYCDLRMYLYSIFGGMERVIEPQYFTSFIIIGPDLLNYEYYNKYTGLRYNLDWESAGAFEHLVKTTNRNELVLPVNIKPQLTLTAISDASERYGGTDKLPNWKLNATVSYEIEVPAFLFMETDYLAENFNMEVRYGSAYSVYNDYQPPVNRELYNYAWDWGLDATSDNALQLDSTSGLNTQTYIGDFVLETRYFHTVTQAEYDDDSSSVLDITLPETIYPPYILIVNSKYGELKYKDHYDLIDDGDTLRIFRDYVLFQPGWVIELYVYKAIGGFVTVTVTSGVGGSTSKDGVNSIFRGKSLTILATPNIGYDFSSWSDDVTSSTNPLTLSRIEEDYSITANFTKIHYNFIIDNIIGDGTATPLISTYVFDDALTIEASPNADWEFSEWTGDTGNIDDPNSANTNLISPLYEDTTAQAVFTKIQYQLTMGTLGEGGSPNVVFANYAFDDALEIQAIPDPGYQFVEWTEDIDNIEDATSAITNLISPLREDTDLKLTFEKIQYTLNVTTGGDGTTNIITDTYEYDHTGITIIAYPNAGFVFDSWTGDTSNIDSTTATTYLISPLYEDTDLQANFVSAVPPAPPTLAYDSDNSESFNSTTLGFTNTGDPGQSVDIAESDSGLVSWVEYSPNEFSTNDSKVNLRYIDLEGSSTSSQVSQLPCNWNLSLSQLTSGNFAIAYTDQRSSPRVLYFAVIDSSGSIITSPVSVDADLGGGGNNGLRVVALNNGNAAVFWDNDNDTAAYMRIYNESLVAQSLKITVDTGFKMNHPRACILSNNNIALTYTRNGFAQGNRLCIYQPDGTEILNTELAGGNIDTIGNSIIPTSDGGFVALWLLKNGNFDNKIQLTKYNAAGTDSTTVTVYDPPAADPLDGSPWDSFYTTQAFLMDNGNIGIAAWSSGPKTLYAVVYDSDLTEVQSATSLTTVTTLPESYLSGVASALGNGKYCLVMQTSGDSGKRVYIHVIKEVLT